MTKHKCCFSFEKKYVGKKGLYEPKKGETGFSIKRDDWVCKCGKTRREKISGIAVLTGKDSRGEK